MGKLTRGYLISAPGCTIVNDSIESVDFEIETGSMDRATLMIQRNIFHSFARSVNRWQNKEEYAELIVNQVLIFFSSPQSGCRVFSPSRVSRESSS